MNAKDKQYSKKKFSLHYIPGFVKIFLMKNMISLLACECVLHASPKMLWRQKKLFHWKEILPFLKKVDSPFNVVKTLAH